MLPVILRAPTATGLTDALPAKNVQLAPSIEIGDVLRVIVILIAVIAGAYLLTQYIAKRSLRKGMKQQPRRSKGSASSQYPELGRLVSVADRIAVDRDKTLMVVEFEGRYYLLGTTADGFQRLAEAEIPEDVLQDREEVPQDAAAEQEGTFGQRFRKAFGIVLRSYLPGGLRKNPGSSSVSFEAQLRERMRADTQKAAQPADEEITEKTPAQNMQGTPEETEKTAGEQPKETADEAVRRSG